MILICLDALICGPCSGFRASRSEPGEQFHPHCSFFPKGDLSCDLKLDGGSLARRGDEPELAVDVRRSLAHGAKTKVAVPPSQGNARIHSAAVVTNGQCKFFGILQ